MTREAWRCSLCGGTQGQGGHKTNCPYFDSDAEDWEGDGFDQRVLIGPEDQSDDDSR